MHQIALMRLIEFAVKFAAKLNELLSFFFFFNLPCACEGMKAE